MRELHRHTELVLRFSVCVCVSDNHDLISMKLYQLTVLRSKQEDEEQEEVLVPSVDNMDLLRREYEMMMMIS